MSYATVIGMVGGGKKVALIAGLLNLSRNTIYYWVRRFKEGDESLIDRQRSGRPRATHNAEDIRICHLIENNLPCRQSSCLTQGGAIWMQPRNSLKAGDGA